MCLLWRTGLGGAAGLPLLRERRRPLPFVFKRGFPPKSKAAQMACKEVETWRRFRQEYQRKIQPNVRTWPGNGLENWLYCLPQRSGWTTADTGKGAILRLPIRPAAEGLYWQGIRQAHRDRLCREKAEKDGSLCCDHYLLAVPLPMRQGDHCRSA